MWSERLASDRSRSEVRHFSHRWPGHHRARTLGIALLILGLIHRRPQADFHNIRHHDGPGEVCEHHDHLLRWHPDAGQAGTWRSSTGTGSCPRGPDDGHCRRRPPIHAHVAGWDATAPARARPRARRVVPAARPADPPARSSLGDGPSCGRGRLRPRAGASGRSTAFGATFRPDLPRRLAPALVLLTSPTSPARPAGRARPAPGPRPRSLHLLIDRSNAVSPGRGPRSPAPSRAGRSPAGAAARRPRP